MAKTIFLGYNAWKELTEFWIDNKNRDLNNVIRILEKKIKKNEIIIPMSIINYIEMKSLYDKEHHSKIAEHMVKFTSGFGMLPISSIWELEIKTIVNKITGNNITYDVRDLIIGKGLVYIIGNKNWAFEADLSYSRDLFFMTDDLNKIYETLVNIDWEKLSEEMNIKNDKLMKLAANTENIEDVLLAKLYNEMFPMIVIYLKSLGFDIKKYENEFMLHDNWKNLLLSMPIVKTWIQLHIVFLQNLSSSFFSLYLLDFLPLAFLYCDIILIDEKKAEFINKFMPAIGSNTKIITDFNELKKLL